MRLPLALLTISCCEWGFYYYLPADSFWYVILCSKQLSLALTLSCLYLLSDREGMRYRSLIVFLCCCAWVDTVLNILWAICGLQSNALIAPAMLLCAWFLFIAFRTYDIESDTVNHDNVALLFLRPRDFKGFAKSFLGLPVSSVCILAGGSVWSFRTDQKKFCDTRFTDRWLKTHVVIDTGVPVNIVITAGLKKLIGTKRGLGILCIYTIRNVLNDLGGAWGPKSLIQYIPGFYAMQVIEGKNDRAGKRLY